ncbi:MAG: hemerythrin domain-containing protein [Rhodoferax sp.]|uniref:hemerythrin domain-containing protein n=1 Tax=Rhodoferax sp. TaxID=50421 RepID=UPI0026388FF8|nr:hemerythrin domain-containing protein [Rhodoferax sp.]MDD2881108.1 hemerythrin domain-containing protein [Rhodoferax sp.]
MNIDKFKRQHLDILGCIAALRQASQAGVSENAEEIARLIIAMSGVIKLHLAVEDQVLYPALRNSNNAVLARMGTKFQDDMGAIASAYMGFAARWNQADNVAREPEGFRKDANSVLKTVYARMHKEDTVFYPAIEAL